MRNWARYMPTSDTKHGSKGLKSLNLEDDKLRWEVERELARRKRKGIAARRQRV